MAPWAVGLGEQFARGGFASSCPQTVVDKRVGSSSPLLEGSLGPPFLHGDLGNVRELFFASPALLRTRLRAAVLRMLERD
eukprot:552742-Pyramimonas_sp.AAC.1